VVSKTAAGASTSATSGTSRRQSPDHAERLRRRYHLTSDDRRGERLRELPQRLISVRTQARRRQHDRQTTDAQRRLRADDHRLHGRHVERPIRLLPFRRAPPPSATTASLATAMTPCSTNNTVTAEYDGWHDPSDHHSLRYGRVEQDVIRGARRWRRPESRLRWTSAMAAREIHQNYTCSTTRQTMARHPSGTISTGITPPDDIW
jgi:hypothetical protein